MKDGAASGLYALEAIDVSKSYPGTRALDSVTIQFPRAKISALMGANGSGKSTLTKVLAGVEHADSGLLRLQGDVYESSSYSPDVAKSHGLHVVHQEPTVFPDLSVAENLAIGSQFARRRSGAVNWKRQRADTVNLLERFHLNVSPDANMSTLSPAEQVLVTIVRALKDHRSNHSGILILDEPTAALPPAEAIRLLDTLVRYAAGGETIVLVSHHLHEVRSVADYVMVLRDGVVAGSLERAEFSHRRIVTLIAGRELASTERSREPVAIPQGEVLRLEQVRIGGRGPISFTVAGGEVLGLAGVLGSGRSSILAALAGVRTASSGLLRVDGEAVVIDSTWSALDAGIAYVPESRGAAAFYDQSVADNMAIGKLRTYFRGWLRTSQIRMRALALIPLYRIKAPSESTPMWALSGGNQQKVILARVLELGAHVLLLDEPTQGVDVAARAEIHELILGVAAKGTAVVLASSDIEELAALVDRCLVLRDGEIATVLEGPAITEESLHDAFAS